ncbi:MAG TPA: serine/threonine protein kinase, partial [Balneolaceae bacterium]|nr:serine/threonine protein kinase [Balneolaceae bacterium]
GILLYELLAGTRPFDLGDKPLSEVEKFICHQTPAKPSQKFSSLSEETKNEIARCRNVSPTGLVQKLSGDLDAIVMKALRIENEARYDSVQQLLDDLKRHKQSRPLIARNDTVRYRFKKFMHRNRR